MSNIGVRYTRTDGSTFVQEALDRAQARRLAARHPEALPVIVVRAHPDALWMADLP